MPPIKHTQLFDFPAYEAAIKETKTNTEAFGKSMDEILRRLNGQQKELTASLKEYSDLLKRFSTNQNGANEALKKYSAEIDTLVANNSELKDTQKILSNITAENAKRVLELSAAYEKLLNDYRALDPTEKDYAQRKKQINDEIKQIIPGIKAYNTALKQGKQTTDAAAGSYARMQQQLTALKNQLKNLPDAFNLVTGRINKNNKEAVSLSKEITRLDGSLKKMDQTMGVFTRNVGNYQSAFGGLGGQIVSLSAGFLSLQGLMAGFNKVIDVSQQFQSLNTALKVVTETSEQYEIAQTFLSATAEKYGQNLQTLTKAYTGLAATTRGTNLEGEGTRKIFTGLIQAGTALKLSNEQIEGSLLAVQQMLSKGTVNAEELRGQLGERLPGAFKLFAQSLGVSESQLGKMLQKGEILANEALPKFAKRLSEVYGSDSVANAANLVNETNRLENAMNRFLNSEKVVNFWAAMKRGLAGFFDVLTTFTESPSWSGFFGAMGRIGGGVFSETALRLGKQQLISNFTLSTQEERQNKLAEQYNKLLEIREKIRLSGTNKEQQRYLDKLKAEADWYTELFKLDKKLRDEQSKAANQPGSGPLVDPNKGAKEREDSIKKQIQLLEKAAKLQIDQDELRRANGEIGELEFQHNKLSTIASFAAKATDLELSLGKKADKARIEELKRNVVDAQTELAKILTRRQTEGTRILPGGVAVPEVKDHDFGDPKKLFDQRAKAAMDAENKAFDIIRAGRDTTFREELDHLERLKAIRIKNRQETAEEEYQIERLKAEKTRALHEETEKFIFDVISTGLEIAQNLSNANFEQRIANLETEKQRELALAGNNAAAREKIEKDYNDRVKKEKRRQAQSDKLFSLFNVAINTAQGVSKTIAEWGMPFAIPFIALTVGQGLLQAALIASRPLPQFKKGTRKAPKGGAMVGEEGYEFIKRDGKLFMTPNEASYTYLKGGEEIYTHSESKRLLENSVRAQQAKELAETATLHRSLASQLAKGKRDEMIFIHARAMQHDENIKAAFKEAVKDIPVQVNMWDERGYHRAQQQRSQRTIYLNDRHKLG